MKGSHRLSPKKKCPFAKKSCPLTHADGHALVNSFAPWRFVMLKLDRRNGSSRPQISQAVASGSANGWRAFLMALMRALSSGVV
jgi:hypothetical protein